MGARTLSGQRPAHPGRVPVRRPPQVIHAPDGAFGVLRLATREEWLVAAIDGMHPWFTQIDAQLPRSVRVSLGFTIATAGRPGDVVKACDAILGVLPVGTRWARGLGSCSDRPRRRRMERADVLVTPPVRANPAWAVAHTPPGCQSNYVLPTYSVKLSGFYVRFETGGRLLPRQQDYTENYFPDL